MEMYGWIILLCNLIISIFFFLKEFRTGKTQLAHTLCGMYITITYKIFLQLVFL